jgi:hypothetical protein
MQAVGVDINTKTAQNLLRHRPSSRLRHLLVATIKTAIGRMFARERYDLRDEANRNGFAVSVALRLCDSPATGLPLRPLPESISQSQHPTHCTATAARL